MTRQSLLRILGHRAVMPVWALLVALAVLLPSLSGPGLWEPQEMKVADDAVERTPPVVDRIGEAPAPAKRPDCPKQPRDNDGARTLTPNLAAVGLLAFGDTEGDMRLLLALLGVIGALATFGIGARLGSPRAGLLGAIVLLSFPLMVLQARQLTSEIGTATGATLIVYGLVAASRPAKWPWIVLDLFVAAAAIAAGCALAFFGGGAFLGLLPPLAAVAIAGGGGLVLFGVAARVVYQLEVRAAGAILERYAIGRRRSFAETARISGRDLVTAAVALLALIGALAVVWVLFEQIYDIQNRAPGSREIAGNSVVPRECWSDALGGIWRSNDDARSTYDSMFEQIGFGLFPWAVLAPVALFGLTWSEAPGDGGERRRLAGRLTLAWAALAWITATVFQRKVGFTIYAGFPACAVAIGIWLDDLLASRHDADRDPAIDWRTGAAGLLVGLWVLLGMITLAKDLQAFPERITSLLVGGDQIKYPAVKPRVLGPIPLRPLLLVLAVLTGLSFALGAWLWRPSHLPKPARWVWSPGRIAAFVLLPILWLGHPTVRRVMGRWGIHISLGLAVLTGIFWAQVWQRTLSRSLSAKNVFAVYRDLRVDGDRLGIMGDMGNSPRYYAGTEWEKIAGREALITFLGQPDRVFALAPNSELCAIHRAFAGKRYFVLDDSNARFMLLSNRLLGVLLRLVPGALDRNPLSTTILREKPDGIRSELSAIYEDKIELIGYTMPRSVAARSRFEVTLYFKVLEPVPGAWKIFAHFDGRGQRFQGDHEPIRGRCATSFWQKGDYIVDTFTVEAGDITFEPGNYQLRVGFFTGTSPNWKNMKVSKAPPGAKDDAERVLLGTIQLD